MRKNKRYTLSDNQKRLMLLQRNIDMTNIAEDILLKKYEDELKKEYPGAKLSELKKTAVNKHQKEYHDIRNNVIPPLYHEKVEDIIKFGKDSVILSNTKNYNQIPKYAENTKLAETYNNLGIKSNLFEVMEQYGSSYNNTNKLQTGSKLINNVIAFDKLSYSYSTVKAAQNLEDANKAYNFFKKSNKFMAYDYETMGGVDQFGYKKVDALTEFAYTIFDKKAGTKDTISTVIGLTAEKEKQFRELIKNANRDGFSSNEQSVIYRRIGLYGHRNTKLAKDKSGMYFVESMADLEYGHRFSDADLNRGFERLRNVYNEQAKLGTTNGGLSMWQKRYAEMMGLMNDKEMSVLDYNGIIADRPWQNNFLGEMNLNKTQREEFLKIAGMKDMFLDTSSERFYDVRTHTRYAANNVGSEAYYPTAEAKQRLKGNTPFSQEGIARTLFAEDFLEGGAHTAGFDTRLLGKLATDTTGYGMNGETFVDRIYRDANSSKSNITGNLRAGNLDLLMANNSVQFYGGGDGALSYVYDPVSKSYRTANQFSFGESVSKEFTKENPIKRGRLYSLDFAGQIDMSDEWVKGMRGVHDEYAQKSLYAIRLNPIFDEKVAGSHQGLRGHTMMYFNSKDQMQSTLSNMVKVAERDTTTGPFRFLSGKAGQEVKDMLTTYNLVDEKLIKSDTPKTVDDVIRKATFADINDTAARMIREDSYNKAINFSQFYDKLTEFNEAPVTKNQANNMMLQLLQSKDRKLSKQVASGKTLELSYGDVQEALGYTRDKGKTYNLISNTLNNQMTSFEYMASQNDVFKAIKNHFYEKNYSGDQLQFKFENILNRLTEQEIADIERNPKKAKALWHNGAPTEVLGKDLNFFNFDTRDFFNEKPESSIRAYTKPIIDEDILRVDLGPGKEYNFVNNLLRKTTNNFNDMSAFQKNNEGITQLRNFVGQVKDSKSYGDLFKQFDDEKIKSYTSADMFASSVIQELRDYRKINPASGYLAEAYTQNATIRNKVLESMSSNMPELYKRIADIDADLPTYVVSNGDKNLFRSHAKTIVDNILVDNIDPLDYANRHGISGAQATHMKNLYGKAKEEYVDYLTDFMESFTTGKDVNFIYDTKEKIFALTNGSQKAIDITLPKIKAQDGNLFVDMGSNKVALHAKIDAKAAIKQGSYRSSDVSVITTLGDAFRESSREVNFYKTAKKGDTNNDILRRAQSVMQNMKTHMRTGAAVDFNDILDIQTPMRVDIKDVMGLAPLLKNNKMLEDRLWRDKDFLSRLNIKTTFDNSNDAYRELMQKNFPELLRVLAEDNGGFTDDNWMGLIAKNISFLGKETQGADLVGMVGGVSHRPGIQLQNNQRPVINQTRSVLYRTEDWKQALSSEEFKNRNISLKAITTNDFSEYALNRKLVGVGKTSAELQVGKLNISEINYRGAISDHYLKKGKLSNREQKVYNKLKSVNLTEQEQVVDPRLASKFFDRAQEQKINTRKQLSFYMDINAQTIETTDELRSMMPQFKLDEKTGTLQFEYGKGVYKNRHDKLLDISGYSGEYTQLSKVSGKFNLGYFSKTEGMLIQENEINKLISGKTRDEAERLLKETFDEAFYVKPTDMVTYKKMLNGFVEKGMGDILSSGLGETDEKINKYISSVDKNLIGRVKTDEFIQEEILNKFDSKIGSQVGIKSKEELKDLIYKERYEAFDTLRDIFGKEHDFSLLANHAQKKHGNTQLGFEELTGTMKYHLMKNGSSENDAMKKIYDDFTNPEHKFVNIKGFELRDGQFHYPNFLEGGVDGYDNSALEKILAKPEYQELAKGLRVKTADGKEVGNFVMTGLSEARDAQWISGKTDSDFIESIADLKSRAKNATGSKKRELLSRINSYESALNWNTKGQKITDREIGILELQRYDNRMLELMQSKLDTPTFEKTMGHVLKKDSGGNFVKENGNYVLDEKNQGRAMLSRMTDTYRNIYMKGTEKSVRFDIEDKNLSETLKDTYLDNNVREGIEKLVNTTGVISKDTAEHLYSMSRGVKAVKFNGARSYSIEQMANEGFNIKKASEIYKTFDQGKYSLEHPDSIFNKNLMLDFGQEFTLDSERYLALPYAPSKLTGDTVVRENFQKKLGAVLGAHDKIEKFNMGIKSENDTKEKLMSSFLEKRTALQEEIEMFGAKGKNGNMGQFNIRLDQSVVAKASGVIALDPLAVEQYSLKEGSTVHKNLSNSYDYALAKFGGNKEKTLEHLNYAPLSRSKFMDKSILQHYGEGNYVNASFAGNDIFKEMGILSDEYLKRSGFGNMNELKDYLATEGITVNAIRTPTIKMDSTAPGKLYLDESLKGKRIKTLGESALARTEDFDGDQPIFSIFKDASGKDSVLAARSGSKDLVWNDIQANMMNRAVGTHQYFHDKLYKTLIDDAENSFKNGDFISLTGNTALDKKIYAEFNIAPTSEEILKHQSTIEELQSIYEGQYGSRFNLTKKDDITNVSNMIESMDVSDRERYKSAAIFDQAFARTEIGAEAKVRKTAIGEINNPLARLRTISNLALPKFGADSEKRDILQKAFEDIEQEVISAKKGTVRENWDKTQTFKTALNNLVSGDAQRKNNGIREMTNWLNTNMDEYFKTSMEHLETLNHKVPDGQDAFSYIRDTFVNTVGSFDSQELQKLRMYDTLGSSIKSYGLMKNSGELLNYISDDRTTLKGIGMNTALDAGLIDSTRVSTNKIQAETAIRMHGTPKDVLRGSNDTIENARQGLRKGASQIADSMRKGIAELSGSKLGLASVGLAAAYMITGFIGSNASQPADLQAQQVAQSDGGQVPQLSDYSQGFQSSTPGNNGYVVNIRGGGSPQTITKAQQSISQTMGNTIDGNINVKMNIVESNGNINDRYLDQLLVNAIGR